MISPLFLLPIIPPPLPVEDEVHTRELLAKGYLATPNMIAENIAFLLDYQEICSFLRAFFLWTGQTISGYKKSAGINS